MDDELDFNISEDAPLGVNLGTGFDTVLVTADPDVDQVRVTFTSSEVGNGDANDSDTSPKQDGLLAVRVAAEDDAGAITGPNGRFDDEGIEFVSDGTFTFDVRDLVTGARRGDEFDVVTLGTNGGDSISKLGRDERYYINGGTGNDRILGGSSSDFLVGGAGADRLEGKGGGDGFIGGGGNDRIFGSGANDVASANVSSDGIDQVTLGRGSDSVLLSADPAVEQVRIVFTSSEVGNGSFNDAGNSPRQDGGLAVRVVVEDGSGATAPQASRYDDESIEFVSDGTFTFDVRDLVSGTQRGDEFDVVTLGSDGGDSIDKTGIDVGLNNRFYMNGGGGNDALTGGDSDDFLVGGDGADILTGGRGDDAFIGGAGDDILVGGVGNDDFIFSGAPGNDAIRTFATGSDTIDLSAYGITFDDVDIAGAGLNTRVDVDTDGDGAADFRITIENATAPVEDDFVF